MLAFNGKHIATHLVTVTPKNEYVAVSIDIYQHQDSMQLGIKLKVTPCDIPRYIQYVIT